MSSGFVSAGTIDAPVERDDEWLQAQQEIEDNRRRRAQEGLQEGGKSLFEVLQSNKAAKQEAFEESIKLKNQFRNLDESEVEFLDSVLESTRKKEREIKEETAQQLELFRRHREAADKAILEGGDDLPTRGRARDEHQRGQDEKWTINKTKRKRDKDKEREGVKVSKFKKTSFVMDEENRHLAQQSVYTQETPRPPTQAKDRSLSPIAKASSCMNPKNGSIDNESKHHQTFKPSALVLYSSDEDDP